MPIIAPIPRDERRLMQKTIHKTRDKNHARRLTAMLMLHRGERISDVARTLCCARSSVGRWIGWFTVSGVEGLKSLPAGRSRRWPFEHICTLLRELIKYSPCDFGYQRSRWSTELLAIKINEITGSSCMQELCVAGCPLPDWYGAEPRQRCVSAILIRMKKWLQSIKHWANAAQNTRFFMRMKWISISTPKSAQTGSYAGSKNGL
jgi:transposase